MKQSHRTLFSALAALLAALSLAACGGDAGVSGQAAAPTAAVMGIASAGAPVTGTVFASDSSLPAKTVSAPINQDGTFTLDTTGLTGPYLLKAVDPSDKNYYSIAKAAGRTNINPLTTAAVAIASGSPDLAALSKLYDSHDQKLQGVFSGMSSAGGALRTTLQPLLAKYGAQNTDALGGALTVNHQGLDGLFDQVAFALDNGVLSVTKLNSLVPILSVALDKVADGILDTGNFPVPVAYGLPGNAVLTLKLQGSLPADTLVRHLSFTLQLPLGVTIDPGASVINTALPTGGAQDAIVYPAPSLSATNNRLSVTLSSLSGFAAGEFLTIRCVVSSLPITNTRAEDFSVVAATMYSDIYRDSRLKNLSIVPTGIVFPPGGAIR
jgi:hypothetical protein